MNAELEAIKDTWRKKTEAKARALEAVGEAKLAEKEGRDSSKFWATWEKNGIEGLEKKLADEQLALCEAYVTAHPEEFTEIQNMSLEECVTALEVFRKAGMEDSEWRVEAWLRHHFEPQNIGGEARARVRLPGPGGKAK